MDDAHGGPKMWLLVATFVEELACVRYGRGV